LEAAVPHKRKKATRGNVGLSKSAGYQVGARRTFPISAEAAWQLLMSPAGLRLWLGSALQGGLARGKEFTLRDGTECRVRVLSPEHHLRMTWQPSGWSRSSTLQVRVIQAARGTTIAFHQERLPNARSRSQRRVHFEQVLDRLGRRLGE